MSKSLGNNIEPETIVKQVRRGLIAAVGRLRRFHRRRSPLGCHAQALVGSLPEAAQYVPLSAREHERLRSGGRCRSRRAAFAIDAWILLRAEELVRKCRDWYGEYAFHKVYRALYDFAVTDLSAVYFDILKDRLYTAGPPSPERRSGQTALYRLNLALTRLLAPILSFTCEEVWKHTKHAAAATGGSVHVDLFPEPGELIAGISNEQRKRAAEWEQLIPVREQVLKALDMAREDKVIGASLEAAVTLAANGEMFDRLEKFASDLPALFIVSQVAARTRRRRVD